MKWDAVLERRHAKSGYPIPSTSDTSQSKARVSTPLCNSCLFGPFSREGLHFSKATVHDRCDYSYATTWEAILRSITSDSCAWCSIVCNARDALPPCRFPSAHETTVNVGLTAVVSWAKGGLGWLNLRLNDECICRYYFGEDPKAGHIESKDSPANGNFKIVSDYIIECSSNHDGCPGAKESNLPTRVIDCSDPTKPRLLETYGKRMGQYCTLSYVWGGEQQQKTTLSNVNTYREGINVRLPQTIADAIVMTKSIGIRYLWVDALCIIQDWRDDMDHELACMDDIYQNAYLTLSVQSAYRADQGFLADLTRTPTTILPCYSGGKLDKLFLRGREMYIKPKKPTKTNALDQRAWCFQESMLSPRRLIITPQRLQYKCRTLATQIPIDNSQASTSRFAMMPWSDSKGHLIFPALVNCQPDKQSVTEFWALVVSEYSRCKTTLHSDKLVALASVAGLFQSVLQDMYIAGLWQENLLAELQWSVDRTRIDTTSDSPTPRPRPITYRAPTWSWASVDEGVKPGRATSTRLKYTAKILACYAIPKNYNLPFGEITMARLTLRAKMCPLMYKRSRCELKQTRFSDGSPCWEIPKGNCFDRNHGPPGGAVDEFHRVKHYVLLDCLEAIDPACPTELYVVLLQAESVERRKSVYGMEGLLVVRDESGVPEQYRRVGKLLLATPFYWPEWRFDSLELKTVALI